jgi:hypothetical protein
MTEEEWLTSIDLDVLLGYLQSRRGWDRQVGMFLIACCRQVEHLIPLPQLPRVLDAGERFAERRIGLGTMRTWMGKVSESKYPRAGAVWTAVWYLCNRRYEYAPGRVVDLLLAEGHAGSPSTPLVNRTVAIYVRLCALLRDMVGNPFHPRPRHDRAWLAAGSLVGRLANSIYAERKFGELPILADALEDAGCTEAALLEHLRGPGPHERGCWALDVILGKE